MRQMIAEIGNIGQLDRMLMPMSLNLPEGQEWKVLGSKQHGEVAFTGELYSTRSPRPVFNLLIGLEPDEKQPML